MAEQQITTALSNMSVNNPKPGLTIFSLPRELRDKIYGYLLDSKYTRVKRSSTQTRALPTIRMKGSSLTSSIPTSSPSTSRSSRKQFKFSTATGQSVVQSLECRVFSHRKMSVSGIIQDVLRSHVATNNIMTRISFQHYTSSKTCLRFVQ